MLFSNHTESCVIYIMATQSVGIVSGQSINKLTLVENKKQLFPELEPY